MVLAFAVVGINEIDVEHLLQRKGSFFVEKTNVDILMSKWNDVCDDL